MASSEAGRSEQAKRFYAERRYLEAAHAYESLFADLRVAKYLFNAAAAREAAGHDAHAYVLLRRYLETPGLRADDHEAGEARMAPLRRRTTALQLRFKPSPRPEDLVITLARTGTEPIKLDDIALQAVDRGGVVEIWAEAGEWSVRTEAPGFYASENSVESTPGATKSLDVRLEPKTTAEQTSQYRTGSLNIRVISKRFPRDLRLKLNRKGETFERPLPESEVRLDLPSGLWDARAESKWFETEPASILIVRGVPQHMSLSLKRSDAFRLSVGGAISGVAAASGLILAITGSLTFPGPCCRPETSEDAQREKFLRRLNSSAAQKYLAGPMLGFSAGFGLGTLILHKKPQGRRAILGVGLGLTIAGAIAAALIPLLPREQTLADARLWDLRMHRGVAAALGAAGSGVGMLTVFLSTRKSRPRGGGETP